MFIVKFGGSVITEKAKDCCFRQEIMDDLATQVKRAGKEMILVHGAGSFGHILAKQYDLNSGFKKKKPAAGVRIDSCAGAAAQQPRARKSPEPWPCCGIDPTACDHHAS